MIVETNCVFCARLCFSQRRWCWLWCHANRCEVDVFKEFVAVRVTHHQPWYSGQDRGPLASNEVFQQGDLSSSLVMTSPCSTSPLFDHSGRRAPVMASGVRQLPCPYCPMRFKRRWNLNMHVHTHTGERPYQCCYCFRAFADRSNMRKHILIHTCKQPMA
nr:zinc finger protein 837-like isoform X11 [Dermacentor andersoni]